MRLYHVITLRLPTKLNGDQAITLQHRVRSHPYSSSALFQRHISSLPSEAKLISTPASSTPLDNGSSALLLLQVTAVTGSLRTYHTQLHALLHCMASLCNIPCTAMKSHCCCCSLCGALVTLSCLGTPSVKYKARNMSCGACMYV